MNTVLFSAKDIATRIEDLADELVRLNRRPEIASPILAGAFVFAADLLRALALRGLLLPVEFLWLRSYGQRRTSSGEIAVLAPPGESVRGRRVLLLDGVLDHGHTLERARELLIEAGAADVISAVAVDKRRADARMRADHAAFKNVDRFVVGYGMDDAGKGRTLPYIAAMD